MCFYLHRLFTLVKVLAKRSMRSERFALTAFAAELRLSHLISARESLAGL